MLTDSKETVASSREKAAAHMNSLRLAAYTRPVQTQARQNACVKKLRWAQSSTLDQKTYLQLIPVATRKVSFACGITGTSATLQGRPHDQK